MNDKQLDKKVRQDVGKVKKDLGILMKDSAARFNRFENSVSVVNENAQKDLFTWVEETVSQLSKDLEKLTGGAKETVADAAATMKKDITNRLIQYNSKAQGVADKAPENIGKKTAKYPWVAVSICLVVGLLVGFGIKPTLHFLAQPQE